MTDFPDVKLKALVNFPAEVRGGTGITVTKENGIYTFDLDPDEIQDVAQDIVNEAVAAAITYVTPEYVTPVYTDPDHAALLQAWLNYGVVNNVPLTAVGSYSVGSALTITGPVSIVCGGSGTATITATGNFALFSASSVDNISISGLTLVGNRGVGVDGFYSALAFSNCDDLRIINNNISNFKGGAIFITLGCLRPVIAHNKLATSQYACAVFKGCTDVLICNNIMQSIDAYAVLVDDATTGDTILTAVQCVNVSINNNIIKSPAATQTGYAIGYSAVKGGSIHNNLIDGGGVSGSIVCGGIVVNSGQDEFNVSQDISILGNMIKNMNGAGGITVFGAQDVTVIGNILIDNYIWSSVLNNAADILVKNDVAHITTRVYVDNNISRKTAATELDIGISINSGPTEIRIGENICTGMAVPYQIGAAAGSVRWNGVFNGTIPSHQAGFRGRVGVDESGIAWVDTGAAWVKIGTQT